MVRAKLFVRSDRVPVVRYEMPNTAGGGHYCSAAYRIVSTTTCLSPQDMMAKEIVAKSGFRCEILDLSDAGPKDRLAAWLSRVRKTPTLVVEGSGYRKYEGTKAISEYFRLLKTSGAQQGI